MFFEPGSIASRGFEIFKSRFGKWFKVMIIAAVLYDVVIIAGLTASAHNFEVAGDLFELIGFTLIFPWTVLMIMWAHAIAKARKEFWQQFATAHGLSYSDKGDPTGEKALMFREGHSQRISNVVVGRLSDRPIRIFEYFFTTGHGKSAQYHVYTVFTFLFAGAFPHLYLNHKKSGRSISAGVNVNIPGLNTSYSLSVPHQYEIEAFAIFTPDVLSQIMDMGLDTDIEIVDHELLIFMPGSIGTLAELEQKRTKAAQLCELLAPRLDNAKFEQIGSHSSAL